MQGYRNSRGEMNNPRGAFPGQGFPYPGNLGWSSSANRGVSGMGRGLQYTPLIRQQRDNRFSSPYTRGSGGRGTVLNRHSAPPLPVNAWSNTTGQPFAPRIQPLIRTEQIMPPTVHRAAVTSQFSPTRRTRMHLTSDHSPPWYDTRHRSPHAQREQTVRATGFAAQTWRGGSSHSPIKPKVEAGSEQCFSLLGMPNMEHPGGVVNSQGAYYGYSSHNHTRKGRQNFTSPSRRRILTQAPKPSAKVLWTSKSATSSSEPRDSMTTNSETNPKTSFEVKLEAHEIESEGQQGTVPVDVVSQSASKSPTIRGAESTTESVEQSESDAGSTPSKAPDCIVTDGAVAPVSSPHCAALDTAAVTGPEIKDTCTNKTILLSRSSSADSDGVHQGLSDNTTSDDCTPTECLDQAKSDTGNGVETTLHSQEAKAPESIVLTESLDSTEDQVIIEDEHLENELSLKAVFEKQIEADSEKDEPEVILLESGAEDTDDPGHRDSIEDLCVIEGEEITGESDLDSDCFIVEPEASDSDCVILDVDEKRQEKGSAGEKSGDEKLDSSGETDVGALGLDQLQIESFTLDSFENLEASGIPDSQLPDDYGKVNNHGLESLEISEVQHPDLIEKQSRENLEKRSPDVLQIRSPDRVENSDLSETSEYLEKQLLNCNPDQTGLSDNSERQSTQTPPSKSPDCRNIKPRGSEKLHSTEIPRIHDCAAVLSLDNPEVCQSNNPDTHSPGKCQMRSSESQCIESSENVEAQVWNHAGVSTVNVHKVTSSKNPEVLSPDVPEHQLPENSAVQALDKPELDPSDFSEVHPASRNTQLFDTTETELLEKPGEQSGEYSEIEPLGNQQLHLLDGREVKSADVRGLDSAVLSTTHAESQPVTPPEIIQEEKFEKASSSAENETEVHQTEFESKEEIGKKIQTEVREKATEQDESMDGVTEPDAPPATVSQTSSQGSPIGRNFFSDSFLDFSQRTEVDLSDESGDEDLFEDSVLKQLHGLRSVAIPAQQKKEDETCGDVTLSSQETTSSSDGSQPLAGVQGKYSLDNLLVDKQNRDEMAQKLLRIKNDKERIRRGIESLDASESYSDCQVYAEGKQILASMEVRKQVIMQQHPGEHVFKPELYGQVFCFPGDLTLAACGFTPGSSYIERQIHALPQEMVVEMLAQGMFQLCLPNFTEPEPFLNWTLYLMSVHGNSLVMQKCYELLLGALENTDWTPTVRQFFTIFINYGASLESLAFLEIDVEKLNLVALASLDSRLTSGGLLYHIQVCMSVLLNAVAENEWATAAKVICARLARLTRHHHNKVHLVRLLPAVPRGVRLSRALALTMLRQLLTGNEHVTEATIPDTNKVGDAVEVLRDFSLRQLTEFYFVSSVTSLVDLCIGNENLKASEKADFKRFIERIGGLRSEIKESVNVLDRTVVKDMIARLTTKWRFMLQNLGTRQSTLHGWFEASLNNTTDEALQESVGEEQQTGCDATNDVITSHHLQNDVEYMEH